MNDFPESSPTRVAVPNATAGTAAWRGSGCILVVDDDDPVRLVLSRALARIGFTAEAAADGLAAMTLFNADPSRYILVLLDFKLPGMDSATVFRQIRSKRADLPVILMSGYNRQDALDNTPDMDLAGFIHKPFTLEALAAELRSVLHA